MDELDKKQLLSNAFSHKVIVNLDVFRSGMEYWI
jgi:hypothetical protein